MAEVYLARAEAIEGFQKLVVLKRILPEFVEKPNIVQMFLNEARLAATLHHHNVAQVYDVGMVNDSYFMTMEYIHGVDLRSLKVDTARRGLEIPLEVSLSIAIGICAGLHYAHEKQGPDGEPLSLVHRDVSLGNVLVSYDGLVKVVDFGIAKIASSDLTDAGSLKGKISYMSPEQCKGEPLDRRSDIFVVGIVLSELTTGRRPFKAASDYATMSNIVDNPHTPLSEIKPGYPKALEAIIQTALQKDRKRRYETAKAMQLALEEFAFESGLRLTSVTLSEFMEKVYGERVDEWKAAKAGGGASIENHILRKVTQHTPTNTPVFTSDTPSGSGEIELGSNVTRFSKLPWIAAVGALGVAAAVGMMIIRPPDNVKTPVRPSAQPAVQSSDREADNNTLPTEAPVAPEPEPETKPEPAATSAPDAGLDVVVAKTTKQRVKKKKKKKHKRGKRDKGKQKWNSKSLFLPDDE